MILFSFWEIICIYVGVFIFLKVSMKKTLVGIGILALCSMIAGCAIGGPKQNNESQKQVVLVSGHPDWKPIMYKSGQSIAGIGVEVAKSVFSDIGFNVAAKYMGTWDVVQEKAKQ